MKKSRRNKKKLSDDNILKMRSTLCQRKIFHVTLNLLSLRERTCSLHYYFERHTSLLIFKHTEDKVKSRIKFNFKSYGIFNLKFLVTA